MSQGGESSQHFDGTDSNRNKSFEVSFENKLQRSRETQFHDNQSCNC